VAYECLTGTPPFTAETPVAIAVAHMHRPVPPLPDDVPAPVAELVIGMLAKPPEDRPQSARWVADRARQLRNELPTSPDMVAATLAGAAGLAGEIAPEAPTDPTLGASLTRADFGKAAITSAALSDAAPGEQPKATGDPGSTRHRRRSAFLAAAVSVAVAAIGGTVAAVLLSSHPMSTAGDMSPVSPAAKSPGASAGTSHRANPSPSQVQVPAGIMATAPNVGVGAGLSTGTATGTTSAEPTKTPTPVQQRTTPPPTTPPPTTTPPTTPPPSSPPPTTAPPASGGGAAGTSSGTNVTGSQ
jgi:serine/threonine protein kinase